MKCVILAGGLGTRLSEESYLRPKPMVEVGGKPIIWHIMKYYSYFGINEFIICAGYKANIIKDYFSSYYYNNSDITFSLQTNKSILHNKHLENWNVTVVDTGELTETGGRIKRIQSYLNNDESFYLTYGDGLSNIDINNLTVFHNLHKNIATVSAVKPPGRFGVLSIKNDSVSDFSEKPSESGHWINGGFFVFTHSIFDYLIDDTTCLEKEPLSQLAQKGSLMAFKHEGFWQPMDTLREKNILDKLWIDNKAPWKIW
jgi:glucose-1-phosphate cytidylyltransferase